MPELSNALGRYEVLREIGRGGMATVYLARQIDLNRLVALKELGSLRTSDPSFSQRFLREARLAGSLSHPNIVTVHDFFVREGVPVISMEYLRRGSLRPYAGAISLAQIGGVLEGVLAGLGHAELHGIVHRDIKPENLLVSDEGRVKIVDFGIAKATNDLQVGAFVTSTGVALGTPNYVAPEQAMAGEIGPWTDLYAVGIVTFELFVGRAPFVDTQEPMAVLLKQINESVPRLSEINLDVPPLISAWVESLLAKDPAARPQSAGDAWADLEDRLVTILGPQWRRVASLPQPDPRSVPSTDATAAVNAAFEDAWAGAGSTGAYPATQAPTLMPDPQSWQGPRVAAAEPSRRRRAWRPVGAIALVALALVAWVATQRARDASSPAGTQSVAAQTTDTGTTAEPGSTTTTSDVLATGDAAQRAAQLRSVAEQYESSASNVAAIDATSPLPARATLIDALRETAAAYRKAADATARDDQPAYAAALNEAEAGKSRVEEATRRVSGTAPSPTDPSSGVRTEAPAAPDSGGTPTDQGGGCSGDSSSDDPSDDECEP